MSAIQQATDEAVEQCARLVEIHSLPTKSNDYTMQLELGIIAGELRLLKSHPSVQTAIGQLRDAMQEACDLLAERKHGSPARSAGHNFLRVRRDGPWVIVYVKDGSGAETTVSLTPPQAFDLAELLRGSGISAAGVKR